MRICVSFFSSKIKKIESDSKIKNPRGIRNIKAFRKEKKASSEEMEIKRNGKR